MAQNAQICWTSQSGRNQSVAMSLVGSVFSDMLSVIFCCCVVWWAMGSLHFVKAFSELFVSKWCFLKLPSQDLKCDDLVQGIHPENSTSGILISLDHPAFLLLSHRGSSTFLLLPSNHHDVSCCPGKTTPLSPCLGVLYNLFVLSIAGTANNVVLALFIKMFLGQKDDDESREKVIQQRIFVLVGWALALLLAQVDSNPWPGKKLVRKADYKLCTEIRSLEDIIRKKMTQSAVNAMLVKW